VADPFATTPSATADTASNTAGRSAVATLTNVPGNSFSGRGEAASPGSGFATMPPSVRPNTGPARISAGTAIAQP